MKAACRWTDGKTSGSRWLEFEHLPSVLVLEARYLEYNSAWEAMVVVSFIFHMANLGEAC